MASLVSAKGGFVGEIDGEMFDIREGDLLEDDHPAVKKWPDSFDAPKLRFPVKRKAEAKVEQATASPGEKRK